MYAICRVEKLKNLSNISGANNHNQRLEDTPNADPEKAKFNIHWGAKDPVARIQQIWEKHQIKPRKNAVMANEYLLSASPEFFEGQSRKEIKAWAQKNLDFLKEKHGEGLVSFDLHLDEAGSPHIHAIVTPIYENAKGQVKLSASQYFDKPKLKQLQSDYADAMKDFGLERGVENSKAKHKTVQKYYGELESELAAATKEAKAAVSEFKEFKGQEPSFFNFKKMFQKAAELVENFAKKYVEMARINVAMKHKFDGKIERLETQMTEFKQDHEKLERLYALQGLENDPEAFEVLEARNLNDAEKRSQELAEAARAEAEIIAQYGDTTPAQRIGISEPVEPRQPPKPQRQVEHDAPGLG